MKKAKYRTHRKQGRDCVVKRDDSRKNLILMILRGSHQPTNEGYIYHKIKLSKREIMKAVINSILVTVSTPKAIPFVTEPKIKKTAILKNGKGEFVDLKAHQLKRDMIKFLENSGLSIEYGEAEGRRGLSEVAGIAVKVSPINHVNYDGGAYIKVPEEDELASPNTLKILKYLRKNGVDVGRYCSINTKDISCLALLKVKEE